MKAQIEKVIVYLVERHRELGAPVEPIHRQAVAAAVLRLNDLRVDSAFEPLYDIGAELGTLLTTRAIQELDVTPEIIQGYGKAAVVGTAVPLECGAALLHPRLGKAVRARLPGATSIMPSVTKRAAPGASVDIPLHGFADMWNFDLFDTVSLTIADSPAPDEIVVAIALSDHGRPLARVRPD
ncbi:amino acid synthesis family protein [Burkholderia anthina]|uniref:amino acid synthesis family protein n=1 Tax=Burkholderia anthina TaxID=179879 RepID=UPI00158D7773|nr:amino acid synthesis family protein [Burkholderia anthina]MBY4867713.1 amino acid synthesis family protein [Burkholderia anthina]